MKSFVRMLIVGLSIGMTHVQAAAPTPAALTEKEDAHAIEAAQLAAYKASLVATVQPFVWGTPGNPRALRVLGMNLLLMREKCRTAWIIQIKEIIKANPGVIVIVDKHIFDSTLHITWPAEDPAWVGEIESALETK